MCPCDMPTGQVCCHCRAAIRNSSEYMPSNMLRALYGGWRVDVVDAEAVDR